MEPKYNTVEQTLLYNDKNKIFIKKIDLRTVVLLDNESTMDLFYNPDLVEDMKKVKKPLMIQSNGGEISINQKAKIPGYNKRVWFIRRAITNIIALKILTEQYRVTYDSNDQMLIIQREGTDLPIMEFLMHYSGVHYYDPTNRDLVFLNTVSKNKEGFRKRQMKSAAKARDLQHILEFITGKEVKWIIRSNHIKDCPVETKYVDNAE